MSWGIRGFAILFSLSIVLGACADKKVELSVGTPTPLHLSSSVDTSIPQDLIDISGALGRYSTTTTPSEPAMDVATTAPEVTVPPTTVALQSLDQRVLAHIDYPIATELAGWRIEFTSSRAGYRGSTFPTEQLIQIYVRDNSTLDELVHVTAHEIGHALDVTHLTDAERVAFSEARGRSGNYPWWTGDGMDDFSVGAGDFAETFAYSQYPLGAWNSRIGNAPGEPEIAYMFQLLAN